MNYQNNLDFALNVDQKNSVFKAQKEKFNYPKLSSGHHMLYFAGHSLGLMPKKAKEYINYELEDWANLGVEGHFHARKPWLPYHEFLTPMQANLVGAKESEVVTMNTLTVNLHLMMVSFYRPQKHKYKILIENNTFPSDKYAVDSQAKFHGYDPAKAIIELEATDDMGLTVSEANIIHTIEKHGDELALIMLGNCNYLSGQKFPFEKIVKAAKEKDIVVGFNLAHGAGNLDLKLHNWGVDFAVWCSYKYLNSGPGGLAACFVHEKHHQEDLPKFCGWWGHDKETRFKMGPKFQPINSVESWQLSNPPIFQLASLRASLEIFDDIGMKEIRRQGDLLTGYLDFLIKQNLDGKMKVLTPEINRGSMLCVQVTAKNPKELVNQFSKEGVIVDFREPNILRITPAPLYNTFEEVYKLVDFFKNNLEE